MTSETLLRRAARASYRAYAGKRRSITAGRVDVGGIRGAVRIARDAHGIPFIEASHETDAWFGLGFCQGQDRALQLEILVRFALLGGQSGDPCSAHYEDQIVPWQGEGVAIASTVAECRASEVAVLELAPS